MPAGFLRPPGDGAAKVINVTIPAAGWTAEAGGYYIDVAADGLLASDCPIVDINTTSEATYRDLVGELASVYRVEALMGALRCHVAAPLTKDVPVRLLLVR